ncbi:MAG: class I SAM-dependent methyltransferase [Pseudomonadota bacterium]|nr:class I SAM-dependent methyltransferase [Pseudomonadota bacterium]
MAGAVEPAAWRRRLVADASRPYLKAGPGLFAYLFARGKLAGDPVYRAILEHGLLAGKSRILDLGCGQALLAAWLRAAQRLHAGGLWPEGWPAAPNPASISGIELMPRDVERACRAVGADADILQGDVRHADFGTADAVVMLDVVHYLRPDEQLSVLQRVRASMPVDGVLLLRICDPGGGVRSRYTQWVDRTAMILRGHVRVVPHFRSVPEWRSVLRDVGFKSDVWPMSHGTPFTNVLIIARAVDHP